MNGRAWQVQIYQMSDAAAQKSVADLLDHVDGLATESTDNGFERFLIVECSDDSQAWSVYRSVMSTDTTAVLRHTAHGLASPNVLAAA